MASFPHLSLQLLSKRYFVLGQKKDNCGKEPKTFCIVLNLQMQNTTEFPNEGIFSVGLSGDAQRRSSRGTCEGICGDSSKTARERDKHQNDDLSC